VRETQLRAQRAAADRKRDRRAEQWRSTVFTDVMLDEVPVDRRVLDRLRPLRTVEVTPDDPRVQADQRRWRQLRRALNHYRGDLAGLATHLYPTQQRLAHTRVLASDGWLPPAPVPLEDITLVHDAGCAAPPIDGMGEANEHCRPLATAHTRYPRYSQAIRDLDPPRLFENRLSYRLLGVEFSGGTGRMAFGHTTYFDMIDVCEALAYETALRHLVLTADGAALHPPPWGPSSWDGLTLRSSIGNPFDTTNRALLAAVDTLTLRIGHDRTATFPLQQRDSMSVATGGRMMHVIPAGEFQPSSTLPQAVGRDFDLWRNAMREYSEELLGNPEHDGNGRPIDYDTEQPFADMQQARREGRVQVYCLGVGQDALTLKTGIYTVALWDAETYDDIFAGMVHRNEEGTIPTRALPFTENAIRALLDASALVPGAAGCLYLAWQHREKLLAAGPG
jgi:hypothetical protein